MTAQAKTRLWADGWTSVEDRLPPYRTDVLVSADDGDHREITVASLDYSEHRLARIWFLYEGYREFGYVTHWMALPDPPVADGKEAADE